MKRLGPLRIAIVGCGTAGQASAILLRRQGHGVTVFERAPRLDPVGAGLLLQPTGLAVLDHIGVADTVRTLAAPVERLHGSNTKSKTVLDVRYADLRPNLVGHGIQRSMLSGVLLAEIDTLNIARHHGITIKQTSNGTLIDQHHTPHGPFDLIIAADGARSELRRNHPAVARDAEYPWGALWFIGDDPDNSFDPVLRQTYHRTREMIGVLPSGRTEANAPHRVSLFWSIRLRDWHGHDHLDLAAWKSRAAELLPQAAPLLDQITSARDLVFAPYRDVVLRRAFHDRVAFLGDAAHAMSPQLGQGVNLALLDAAALADAIESARTVPEALRNFDRARRPGTRFYQRASRHLTPLFQSSAAWIAAPRDAVMPILCRAPYFRRQTLLSLAGVKTGPFTSTPLP